jgi:hypothetical protein
MVAWTKVQFRGVNDGRASHVAIDEDEVANNRFVTCKFGEPNNLALVRLVGGHRSLLRGMQCRL